MCKTNEEMSAHLKAAMIADNNTACNSWHSHTEYHSDLVSEAYDSEEWIPDDYHTITYAMYVTETYCTSCGEVVQTSEPWHY